MGCASSTDARLDRIDKKLDVLLRGGVAEESGQGPRRDSLRTEGYDVFVSHAKKLPESEERAVWVSDIVEGYGLRPFFDRSDLTEITEESIKTAMLATDVCVTVLDPFTFNSIWVFKENRLAANVGIPIVCIFDADRFRWEGQLDKWLRLYPWVFARQVVPISKSQRQASVTKMLAGIARAAAEGRTPPAQPITDEMGTRLQIKVGVGGSRETETRSAVETAHKQMRTRLDGHTPSLIIVGFTCTHEASEVAKRTHELSPSVPMIGCTTCRGVVLNDTWLTYQKEFAMGMWGISDDAGTYTTIHLEERPAGLRDAVLAKLAEAVKVREGEVPSFAVLLGSPGDEEIILDGMQAALGSGVPILGGSSGDNKVLGEWRQIAKVGTTNFQVAEPTVSSSGITVVVAWASCQVATTLTSGFRKTEHKGTVTKVDMSDHGRTILEIDRKPIKDVYEKWSQGAVVKDVEWKDGVATVLASSSFCPLGECDGDYTRVMHPAFMNAKSGGLTTFADAHEGMEITMLNAAPETLAKKISQSARGLLTEAAQSGDATSLEVQDVVGAFMIFCGGLVMAIDDAMPMAAEQLAEVVGQSNTMGVCCFGEQGMNARRKPIHGNLMFGCLLFSNKPRVGRAAEGGDGAAHRRLKVCDEFGDAKV